jgi:hypothetical protein
MWRGAQSPGWVTASAAPLTHKGRALCDNSCLATIRKRRSGYFGQTNASADWFQAHADSIQTWRNFTASVCFHKTRSSYQTSAVHNQKSTSQPTSARFLAALTNFNGRTTVNDVQASNRCLVRGNVASRAIWAFYDGDSEDGRLPWQCSRRSRGIGLDPPSRPKYAYLAHIYPERYGNTSLRNVGVLQPGLQEVTSQKLVPLIFHYFLREIVKTMKSSVTTAGLSKRSRQHQYSIWCSRSTGYVFWDITPFGASKVKTFVCRFIHAVQPWRWGSFNFNWLHDVIFRNMGLLTVVTFRVLLLKYVSKPIPVTGLGRL